MRFMILLKADKHTEAGVLPDEKLIAAMMKYNEEMVKAGVLLVAEGLHLKLPPHLEGLRGVFAADQRRVEVRVPAPGRSGGGTRPSGRE